jgi:hypothetical protein
VAETAGKAADVAIEAICRVFDPDWKRDDTEHTPEGEELWDKAKAALAATEEVVGDAVAALPAIHTELRERLLSREALTALLDELPDREPLGLFEETNRLQFAGAAVRAALDSIGVQEKTL